MKGSMLDVLYAIPILFVIAVFLLSYAYANETIMGAFENTTIISNATKLKITTPMRATFDAFNYGFLAIVVSTFILISALAYYSNMHPMFFPISLLICAIAIFMSMFLANAYWSFVNSTPEFLALANQFWVVTYLMKNLPFVTFAFSGLLLFVTYRGKGQVAQRGGL